MKFETFNNYHHHIKSGGRKKRWSKCKICGMKIDYQLKYCWKHRYSWSSYKTHRKYYLEIQNSKIWPAHKWYCDSIKDKPEVLKRVLSCQISCQKSLPQISSLTEEILGDIIKKENRF